MIKYSYIYNGQVYQPKIADSIADIEPLVTKTGVKEITKSTVKDVEEEDEDGNKYLVTKATESKEEIADFSTPKKYQIEVVDYADGTIKLINSTDL